MSAEKYVTDFEMSKKLKDAGYPQEGAIFYWVNKQASFQKREKKEEITILVSAGFLDTLCTQADLINCCVAAPTLGELIERTGRIHILKIPTENGDEFFIEGIDSIEEYVGVKNFSNMSLTNALAMHWVVRYDKKIFRAGKNSCKDGKVQDGHI